MKVVKCVLALAVVIAVAGLSRADCGKVMVVTCPPGMTLEEYIAMLQKGTNVVVPDPPEMPNMNNMNETDPDANEGKINIEPLGGDDIKLLADGRSRAYFAEPSQRAVIAWNGKREILVLKTEERSLVGKGAMLSFLPLPGKPIDVRKGDQKLYDRSYNLVKAKLDRAGADFADVKSAGSLPIERTIGAHHIFWWKEEITRSEDFAKVVQGYVRQRFGTKAIAVFGPDTERVIKEYIADGYHYFAFDLLLETDKKHSEKVAIEYEFESPFVYYPLRDSQSGGGGDTRVELVVFTEKEINASKGKVTFADKNNHGGDIMTLGKMTVPVSATELKELHPGMAKLMGGKDVRGRVWVLDGKLNGFKGDVQALYVKK